MHPRLTWGMRAVYACLHVEYRRLRALLRGGLTAEEAERQLLSDPPAFPPPEPAAGARRRGPGRRRVV